MSKIRSKNTKVELVVFRELRKRKIYFQKHYKKVAGSPDIAIPRKKIAIFIDGDFWHGRNFKREKNRLPKIYWRKKIELNIARDKKNRARLKRQGWKVLKVWERDITKESQKNMGKVVNFINQNG